MTSACELVRLRLAPGDAARRLGQALWMMAGEPFTTADLVWAESLLGRDAEQLLWDALLEAGCFEPAERGRLNVWALASFMCSLLEPEARDGRPGLVWTFPAHRLSLAGLAADGYSTALKELVGSAASSLTIVSPYLEAKGVGHLEEAITGALFRGVNARVVTHEADDLGSMSSGGLRSLRTSAAGLSGNLSVYTTSPTGVLMHMKAVVADGERGLVGSANLTGKGLAGNVEAGFHVGKQSAQEIQRVVEKLVATGLAEHVFSTH